MAKNAVSRSIAQQVGVSSIIPDAPPEFFAVQITDGAMHPRIRPGECVVVDPARPLVLDDEVLVTLKDGRNLARIFKFWRDGLVSLQDIQGRLLALREGEVQSLRYIVGVAAREPLGEE
jgi:hypothetical protein